MRFTLRAMCAGGRDSHLLAGVVAAGARRIYDVAARARGRANAVDIVLCTGVCWRRETHVGVAVQPQLVECELVRVKPTINIFKVCDAFECAIDKVMHSIWF